jgi:hypothetical protein
VLYRARPWEAESECQGSLRARAGVDRLDWDVCQAAGSSREDWETPLIRALSYGR